ncbi:hypothetical protein GGQ74_000581 [Desulfobaculum xiamenense]|uniref:HD domain-containing protein n=1 Tax=Desulfobaculum xiamenense TaxID=995050 RepID=A0A846QFC4_9BACT|nr:hypothetical protein [Desulfobaculum xiamenense]NJB66941.1 hypothetical protein [Desulfobaculum xiamenense]
MNETLRRMKNEAKILAAKQILPGFYQECSAELHYSNRNFFDHPMILRLQEDVIPFLYDDASHGVVHAKKVAIEAGAIVLCEARGNDMERVRQLALLAQMSGLMHDTCRLEEDHAEKGAEVSGMILGDYPISDHDKELIAFAISDHEAFRERRITDDPEAELLANALYDADKFRWGPDNFSTTLWEMCDYNELSVKEILDLFPAGMEKIREIAETFRTRTGQTFGPEFIELGLALAPAIFRRLKEIEQELLGC